MQKKKSLIWGICAVLALGLAVSTSAGKQEKVQAASKPSVANFLKKVKSAKKNLPLKYKTFRFTISQIQVKYGMLTLYLPFLRSYG